MLQHTLGQQSYSSYEALRILKGALSKSYHPSSSSLMCLSYCYIEELMQEHGRDVDHAMIQRWMIEFSPKLEKKFHQRKRLTCSILGVDETHIEPKAIEISVSSSG